jgi:hypothetical protein
MLARQPFILRRDAAVPSTGSQQPQPVRFVEDVAQHAHAIHVAYSVLILEIIESYFLHARKIAQPIHYRL